MALNPDRLTIQEVAQLREILASRQPLSGVELAAAARSEQALERRPIDGARADYWSLVLGESRLDLGSFSKLLDVLGRSVAQFEGDMKAVQQQRRAEAQQAEDARQRDEILERARPVQERLDTATSAIFGSDWQARLDSGEMSEAPYLVDLERGTVTTKVEVLKAPCAELQQALTGIDRVFKYGFISAPTYLADAREAFDHAVDGHLARVAAQRFSA